MIINSATKKALDIEFIYSKIKVFSPKGKVLKKELVPFKIDEIKELNLQYNFIEKLIMHIKKSRRDFVKIRNLFKEIKNLDNTFSRLENDQILTVTEFFEIKNFLFVIKDLENIINKLDINLDKRYQINRIKEVESLLDPEKIETRTFYIYNSYSKKLFEVRKRIKELKKKEKEEKKKIKKDFADEYVLKVRRSGEIIINKDESVLVEKLSNDHRLFYKSETAMYITFTLKNSDLQKSLQKEIDRLKLLEENEVKRVRSELSEKIRGYLSNLMNVNENIGNLDLIIGKTFFSIGFEGIRPMISEKGILINKGRHIVLEENLRKENKEYTPISIELNKGVSLVTGANMGGKTVSLKMIGFLVYIAQLGMFVPAKEFKFKPVNFLFTSIGDAQNIKKGLSTFGSEIEIIKEAINISSDFGLLLIDELARGTNPKEGYALSKAIINFLKKVKVITVISTHFDGLVDKDIKHFQVKGLKKLDKKISSKNIQEYMDYRLIEVASKKKVPMDALNIAKMMGLEESILKDAENILKKTGGLNE